VVAVVDRELVVHQMVGAAAVAAEFNTFQIIIYAPEVRIQSR
jgi:hypothetical protein